MANQSQIINGTKACIAVLSILLVSACVTAGDISMADYRANLAPKDITSNLQWDRNYANLPAADKKLLRSMYKDLKENDEPPFPLNGLYPIYEVIFQVQRKMPYDYGEFSADVLIDSNGMPESMTIYSSPGEEVAKIMSSVLMNTKYKSGKCDGVPCKMPYRFDYHFRAGRLY